MPYSQRQAARKTKNAPLAIEVRRIVFTLTLAMLFGAAVNAKQQSTPAPHKVTLVADGETKVIETPAHTVGELLAEQKIHLGEHDRCSTAVVSPLQDGATVTITRVRTETVVERTYIPFKAKQTYSSALPVGQKKIVQAGKKGERAVTFRDHYKDNKRTERIKVKEVAVAPRLQHEVVGTRGMTLASRGYFGGRRVIEMRATGYGPSGNGKWGMQTATGIRPGFGVVAVDPRFIPLGTRLYIEGYGYAVAGDTGGAIKGDRIDLGYDNDSQAEAVGRKKVRVLILN